MATPKSQIFRPDVLPRRNEFIAWGVFILAAVAFLIFRTNDQLPAWVAYGVALLFVLAAGLSLGNWMDRRTQLAFSVEGLEFQNGLRHIKMSWRDVQSVQVAPSGVGKAVRVTASRGRFSFTVSGGMRLLGKRRGKFGFGEGDELVKEIVRRSGLPLAGHNGTSYYYARS